MYTGNRTHYLQLQHAKAGAKLLHSFAGKPSTAEQRGRRKSELDQRLNKRSTSEKPKLIPVQKRKPPVKTKPKSGFKLHLPDLKSPTFLQDSLQGITSLQQFCQQCLGYVQQATTMLDQLQGTAKSLHEAGVWQRLIETKGKNLNAGDLTNMLVALMNTPIGGTILKGLGPKDSEPSEISESAVAPATAPSRAKQLPAPKQRKKRIKKPTQTRRRARDQKQR